MKKQIYAFLACLITTCAIGQNNNLFYYYKGNKQILTLDTTQLFTLSKGKRLGKTFERWTKVSLNKNTLKKGYSEQKDSLNLTSKIIPCFLDKEGNSFGLSSYFYVKLKQVSDSTFLKEQALINHVSIIRTNPFRPEWYLLSCTDQTSGNAIDMANHFYESGYFEAAEPDFIQDNLLSLAVNDPYYTDQWNLANLGQYGNRSFLDIDASQAWQLSTGKNVVVAVVDDGIELNHPDLQKNIYASSYDAYYRTSPCTLWGEHGTACAGIIGAVNNSSGITGVAPDCKLMSVRHPLSNIPTASFDLAAGIEWAWQNNAEVISCSWRLPTPTQIIDEAITNAITKGRNGKGCIMIFAVGNDNKNYIYYPANLKNTIAVGAMSPCGERKSPSSCDGEKRWGSHYGDQLDVVAPGVLIPTTDLTGAIGINSKNSIHINAGGTKRTSDYSDTDYTVWFNGTSSACPHVAGIAALILAVRPELTQQEVRSIIQESCVKLPGYTFTNTSAHPDGSWNQEVGHGLVNAYRALVLATKSFKIEGPTIVNQKSTYTLNYLPKGATLQWSTLRNTATVTEQAENRITYRFHPNGAGESDQIQATVTYKGHTYTTPPLPVWVANVPVVEGIEMSTYSGVTGEYTLRALVSDPGVTCTWGIRDAQPETYRLYEIPYPGDASFVEYPQLFKEVDFYAPGYYTITVSAQNRYGISNTFEHPVQIYAAKPRTLFTLYPTPASGFVMLRINEEENEAVTPSRSNLTDNKPYQIQLWSDHGLLRTLHTSGREVRIPLDGLQPGLYFVHLLKDGRTYKQKLQVR